MSSLLDSQEDSDILRSLTEELFGDVSADFLGAGLGGPSEEEENNDGLFTSWVADLEDQEPVLMKAEEADEEDNGVENMEVASPNVVQEKTRNRWETIHY